MFVIFQPKLTIKVKIEVIKKEDPKGKAEEEKKKRSEECERRKLEEGSKRREEKEKTKKRKENDRKKMEDRRKIREEKDKLMKKKKLARKNKPRYDPRQIYRVFSLDQCLDQHKQAKARNRCFWFRSLNSLSKPLGNMVSTFPDMALILQFRRRKTTWNLKSKFFVQMGKSSQSWF